MLVALEQEEGALIKLRERGKRTGKQKRGERRIRGYWITGLIAMGHFVHEAQKREVEEAKGKGRGLRWGRWKGEALDGVGGGEGGRERFGEVEEGGEE